MLGFVRLGGGRGRTPKTLPILEANQKELGEGKKAVGVRNTLLAAVFQTSPYHPRQVQECGLLLKQFELEKVEKRKIAEAVSTAEVCLTLITGISPDHFNSRLSPTEW